MMIDCIKFTEKLRRDAIEITVQGLLQKLNMSFIGMLFFDLNMIRL